MEFESYADVIDSFERDDMGYASLTDYINGENIKIKEIDMDPMGDLKKALSSKKDGGIMVAIENFNRGGMAGGKTYHQYHDQYVPMDEESMMYANGGGVGSMMQPKKERVSFRGGGMDMGNASNQAQSASMGGGNNRSSRSTGSGTRNNPHTDSGTSKTSTVSGNTMRSAARDFVQTLNNNNAIRANQTGTRFTPYGGGSRPQGSGFGNFMSGIIPTILGFVNPFLGMAARGIMGIPKGIVNFNNKIQNSDFGKSTSLADYLDMRSYGGFDERNLAAQKNMDEAAAITARLEGNTNIKSMPNVNITGLNNNDYEGEIGAVNNNDFIGLNTNATDMQNYMTDQANFTQPGITPTNLNDFEGIRSIPQLNNNDYQLGTPQLNNNDFIGLDQPGITPTNLNDFIGVNRPQEFVSNNPIGGVDQFAKEMEALEASLPMGVNRIMTPNQMGGTLQDFYTNKNLTGATTGGVPSNANSMFEVFNDNINFNDQASLPGNNMFAEITQKDIDRFKQPMTQMMDFDTYKSINTDSTLTPQEFEQLKAQV